MQISIEKLEKVCLKIIHTSFYLILFTPLVILPFFFYSLIVGRSFCFMALTEVLFFTWLFLAILVPKYRPKKNILLISFSIFLVILTMATIFGVDPIRSFWSAYARMGGLLMWLHLFALFLTTSSVFNKKNWLNFFIFSITIATIGSATSLFNKMGIEDFSSPKDGSFIGNSSFLASYLMFNLYFAIYVWFSLKEKKEFKFLFFDMSKNICQALIVIGSIMMIYTLLISEGRAAIISFFGSLFLLMFLWLALQAKKKKIKF